MGTRSECLFCLVVLLSSVLQDGGAMDQGGKGTPVNPLLSVEEVLEAKAKTESNRGEAEDLAVAFRKGSGTDVQKFMVQKALEKAWRVYKEQQQGFLRFQWKGKNQGEPCMMWVAFNSDEKIVNQHGVDAMAELKAESDSALVAVMPSEKPSQCVAAFLIADEEESLKAFQTKLMEYVKSPPAPQLHGYGYVHETRNWILDVNPLVSLKKVLRYKDNRIISVGNKGVVVLRMTELKHTGRVGTERFEKALTAAWKAWKSSMERRFFRFDWDETMLDDGKREQEHHHVKMWVAFSSDREMVEKQGEAVIKRMLETTPMQGGIISAMNVEQTKKEYVLYNTYTEEVRKAAREGWSDKHSFYYQHHTHPYHAYVEGEECVAAYFLMDDKTPSLAFDESFKQYKDIFGHQPEHYSFNVEEQRWISVN